MPTRISKEEARKVSDFVSGALADGFKLDTQPGAVPEAAKRYNKANPKRQIPRLTFRARYDSSVIHYGFTASVKRGSKLKFPFRGTDRGRNKVSDDKLAEAVLYALRRRAHDHNVQSVRTAALLSAKTGFTVDQVKTGLKVLIDRGYHIIKTGDAYDIHDEPPTGLQRRGVLELISRDDNTFSFSGIGDLHAASKHCRWDVREDLIRRAEHHGVQAVFDTGNWIDGEASFNRYELETVGLEQQCQLLARNHPRTKLPIYAVAGDDHEGWYNKSMGIDVGRYNEDVMRDAGHNWTNLGYMEAEITLKNANSGRTSKLLVCHPGGGSSYAISYKPQKIIESYEGGEKPAIALYGHYHKIWAGLIRNVWIAMTGCAQDQSSFMRKKSIEAHVGGFPWIDIEQDPRTGAIMSMTAPMIRYFHTGYYSGSGNRWSNFGAVKTAVRTREGIAS